MAEIPPPPPDPEPEEPLLGRLMGASARGGLRSAGRLAGATGLDRAVQEVAEEAVVRALESPAAERAIARALESPAVERSLVRALDSEMIDRTWERLLASDEAQKLVERIAQAPEVRQAIAYQGVGLLDDVGAQIGRIARRIDRTLERVARVVLRRPKREQPAPQAGLFTRGLALALDAVILNLIFFAISSLIVLGINAVVDPSDGISDPALVAGTFAWAFLGSAYLVSFWALSGETPGMRFLDLRLYGPHGPRLGLRRAIRRLVWVVLSALPAGLGLWLALYDERRRTLADRRVETEVRYLPPRREAPWATPEEPAEAVSAAPARG